MAIFKDRGGLLLGLVGAVLALAGPGVSRASFVVNPGYDLFQTAPGTSLAGVPFGGVPLGSFDFENDGVGPVPTGTTDTIVRRLSAASVVAPGVAAPIDIRMVALQLVSLVPADFGLGLGIYYVTLQSVRGGPQSEGKMTITFGPEAPVHGTFDSFIDVYYDIRFGSLTGAIALSSVTRLTSDDVPWGHLPPPGAFEIPGINTFLNGTNRLTDFWPVGPFQEMHPGPPATIHVVAPAIGVPEPSTILPYLVGIAGLGGVGRYRRRSAS